MKIVTRIGVKSVTAEGKPHWRYKDLPETETFMSAAALAAAWCLELNSEQFSVRRFVKHDTENQKR